MGEICMSQPSRAMLGYIEYITGQLGHITMASSVHVLAAAFSTTCMCN